MYTWKGRVVYNRKVHMFKWRDISRILRKMRHVESIEEFTKKSIAAFQESMEVVEEDYIDAFRFSLWAFWQWVKDPQWYGTYGEFYSKSRSLGTDIEALREDLASQEAGIPQSWDIEKYGVAMAAVMINLIEEIKEEIDASS